MCHNPDYDLEAFETRLEEHLQKDFIAPSEQDAILLKPVIDELLECNELKRVQVNRMLTKHGLKHHKNSFILQAVYLLVEQGVYNLQQEEHVQNLLRIKRCKSHSGILSITVFTSPYPSYTTDNGTQKTQMFTCKNDCHFCPNEPGQPRSYLKGEPGVLRANRFEFDACRQVWGRLNALYHIGHKIRGAKLELLVLGGTWTSYPWQYRQEFVRDMYYAVNTFGDSTKRDRLSLSEELTINKQACCRVIGLTVEFRPDSITKQEIHRLRSYGCTRVQLGVQHLDDDVLRGVNRGCTTDRFKKSLKMLKDVGFKVDIHIMANLPFSNPAKDRAMMLNRFLGVVSPVQRELKGAILWEKWDISEGDVSADQWKLYPCETVPYTKIEEWYRNGTYMPYDPKALYQLLYDTKCAMYPWIRTNRIIRDISKPYIICSSNEPNTGQVLLDELKKNGHQCMCIRCREVKEMGWDGTYQLVVRQYTASGGEEFFISAESSDSKVLYGFIRLRLCTPAAEVFPELEGSALIRELHVYSNMNGVGENSAVKTVQHQGLGRRLLATAEDIAKEHGYDKIAVIAGVGVQQYYAKFGYSNDSEGKGDYMMKYF